MKKKMHVAIIVPNTHSYFNFNLKIGGAERQVSALLNYFEKNPSVSVSLITKYSENLPIKSKIQIFQLSNPKFFFTFSSIYFTIASFFRIMKINRTQRIDIINPHMLGVSAIPAIFAGKILRIPTLVKVSGKITQVREQKSQYNILDYFIKKLILFYRRVILQNIDFFQVLNTQMKNELEIEYSINEDRIFLLPNGITMNNIQFQQDKTHILNYGFVGRLEPTKMIPVLLTAFKKLLSKFENVKLLIFGDGAERSKILSFIKKNNLHHQIILKGFEKNQERIYDAIDVFILTSQGEGISNSLLEAMAHGIPVIASKVAGNVDVISNGKNGLLFRYDSPEELFHQMLKIKDNINMANEIRRNARSDIENIYSLNAIGPKLIQIYLRCQKKEKYQKIFRKI